MTDKLRRAARHDRRLPDGAYRYLEDVIDMYAMMGNCHASQQHFAARFGVSERSVRNWETTLVSLGYLMAAKSDTDGRRRHLRPAPSTPDTGNQLPVDTGNELPETGEIPENERQEIPENERQGLIDIYIPLEGRDKSPPPPAEAPPDEGEAEEQFAEDSWQLRFASTAADKLASFGLLPGAVQKDRPKHLQQWALHFDRLHRLDGHSQEEIREVMKWLLVEDNWWIENGTVQSMAKLRKKVRGEESTYFEKWLTSKQRDANKTPSKRNRRETAELDLASNFERLRRATGAASDN